MFLSVLSNLTAQHNALSTSHTSTSSHRAFCRSASLSQLGPPELLKGGGGHMSSLDTHKLASLLLCLFFASTSEEGCDLGDGVEGVFSDRTITSASGSVHVQEIIH